jgi:hypothetical protein
MEHEQRVAYLKGLVTGVWNWVAWAFPPMPSRSDAVVSMASQRLDTNPITSEDTQSGNAGSVSTGVHNKPKTSRLVHRQWTPELGG